MSGGEPIWDSEQQPLNAAAFLLQQMSKAPLPPSSAGSATVITPSSVSNTLHGSVQVTVQSQPPPPVYSYGMPRGAAGMGGGYLVHAPIMLNSPYENTYNSYNSNNVYNSMLMNNNSALLSSPYVSSAPMATIAPSMLMESSDPMKKKTYHDEKKKLHAEANKRLRVKKKMEMEGYRQQVDTQKSKLVDLERTISHLQQRIEKHESIHQRYFDYLSKSGTSDTVSKLVAENTLKTMLLESEVNDSYTLAMSRHHNGNRASSSLYKRYEADSLPTDASLKSSSVDRGRLVICDYIIYFLMIILNSTYSNYDNSNSSPMLAPGAEINVKDTTASLRHLGCSTRNTLFESLINCSFRMSEAAVKMEYKGWNMFISPVPTTPNTSDQLVSRFKHKVLKVSARTAVDGYTMVI